MRLSVQQPLSPPPPQSLEVKVWRNGREHEQRFSRGQPLTELLVRELPPEAAGRRGTQVGGGEAAAGRRLGRAFSQGAAATVMIIALVSAAALLLHLDVSQELATALLPLVSPDFCLSPRPFRFGSATTTLSWQRPPCLTPT